ncbi:peptidylprolyl isomerase [Niveispirillum sp. KHB5.9]|uniref:peptidylprolyl isomerase n=1 Tax=Niveispirillum sp. KHB5.9 TaxID=3400269 RepID=UPI003A85D0E9
MLPRLLLFLCLILAVPVAEAARPPANPDDTLVMELKSGTVIIQMRPDLAPIHVARIKQLARRGFYDGVPFHRVVAGYIAQAGDRSGTGRGGTGRWLELEPSKEPHVRGSVSMARGLNRNSADSQFFILMRSQEPTLDGNYTLWGHVVKGIELIDKLKSGDKTKDGWVKEADRIISMRVQSDPPAPPKPAPARPQAPPK